MPTWDDVTTIALSLPETAVSTAYGTPAIKVKGKGFLRLRTEAEGGLVVFCDLDKKAELLRRSAHRRADRGTFYTTPHYDGYGAILIKLEKVKRDELAYLITESWRRAAPVKLLRAFDETHPLEEAAARPPRPSRARVTAQHRRAKR
jgi:hypothetical protein